MSGVLGSIVNWLLGVLLRGLFGGMNEAEKIGARVQAREAKNVAVTADEARVLEREIMEGRAEIDAKVNGRKPSKEDPFGYKAWNRGE